MDGNEDTEIDQTVIQNEHNYSLWLIDTNYAHRDLVLVCNYYYVCNLTQTIRVRVYTPLDTNGGMHKSQPCKSPGSITKILFYTCQPSKISQCQYLGWLKSVKEHFCNTTRTFAWQGPMCGTMWR